MHGIEDLKEMLCKELEEYGKKGELSAGTLDIVDKLAHAVKNLDKIIEESDYSERYYDGNNYGMNGGSYRGSYARRNGRRNSMGRYSTAGIADQLRTLMEDAPDDKTRREIERLADKMESM